MQNTTDNNDNSLEVELPKDIVEEIRTIFPIDNINGSILKLKDVEEIIDIRNSRGFNILASKFSTLKSSFDIESITNLIREVCNEE